MEINELYRIFRDSTGIATDSRKIAGGELFFALKGENFDGNAFALKALENGAGYAVVEKGSAADTGRAALGPGLSSRLIPVDDTLATLQALARWHRSMTFVDGKPITVIGLTGTNGKTTTKELIKAVLSVRYNVTATEGNLNNSIGVPLSLLKIDSRSEIAIIEMGASHPGDIKELVSVCLPNYGLITNVGKAHLLGFGSFEGVKKAKGELYDYIQRTADKVFIDADNRELCKMAEERPDLQLIPYGVECEGATMLPSDAVHPYLRLRLHDGTVVNTALVGSYNAANVMAALAVGRHFGVPQDKAVEAIAGYVPSNSRSQLVKAGGNTLIIDAYNANPSSMEAALENFRMIDAEKKALMLGDMLELGADSSAEHEKTVMKALSCGADKVYLAGEEFMKAASSIAIPASCHADVKTFKTSAELADSLEEEPLDGYAILIKGSRGTRMENVMKVLAREQ